MLSNSSTGAHCAKRHHSRITTRALSTRWFCLQKNVKFLNSRNKIVSSAKMTSAFIATLMLEFEHLIAPCAFISGFNRENKSFVSFDINDSRTTCRFDIWNYGHLTHRHRVKFRENIPSVLSSNCACFITELQVIINSDKSLLKAKMLLQNDIMQTIKLRFDTSIVLVKSVEGAMYPRFIVST